ncbi:hypothetical protein [Nodosilinea sp. E11]|uniref:ArnT family glycosyltransferase n=1 Tax=Nodosilinea sp. E11 TaxID=3037479 RepID=UPI0029347241|nr:hypothetical protein [Nodosilinea sp. E11]WOD41414.1 hypothetical protein RRF56_11475 [Nodosilinea sp. E11]
MQLTHTQQKFLFLLSITVLYLALIAWLDGLRGPYWWDEETFWDTSLSFSDRLLPSLSDLRDYKELNTPLPFILFGLLEYLFGQGIWAGRLFNLVLSIAMVFIIGWPTKDKGGRAIVCLIGLFLCPYYLWLSGRLYTEMLACFWVLLGTMGYVRNRSGWSCLAFILAIATRQYMVAFPAAIATYELIRATSRVRQTNRIDWPAQRHWILPLVASCSLFFWFYLFQGLAPEMALEIRSAPDVQQTIWGVELGGAIHYLSFIGLYIVIPEFILFNPRAHLRALSHQWDQQKYRVGILALGLLLFMLVFPPQELASGNVKKLAEMLPYSVLSWGFYYILSLLTCVRFARPNLTGLLILFNAVIMVKAHPWDRYVLPMVVVFWYLKSIDQVDHFLLFWGQKGSDPAPQNPSFTEPI